MVKLSFFILTGVEIVLYSLHCSVLILLIVKRKKIFNGLFYNVLRIVLLSDLIYFFYICINFKLPFIPFLVNFCENSELMASFIFHLSVYVNGLQFVGHTMISFNRFTAVCFPVQYGSIWKRRWYTVLIIVIPFCHICWKFQEQVRFYYLPNDGFSVRMLNPVLSNLNYIFSVIMLCSTTILAAFFNFFAFLKITFHKQFSKNLNVNEKKLLYLSFIVFITQILRALHVLATWLFPSSTSEFLNSISFLPIINIIYDIFALSSSVSLLFLSSSTRKAYISFYTRKNGSTNPSFRTPHNMYPSRMAQKS